MSINHTQKIEHWISKLDPNVTHVQVKAGEKRNSLSQVATVQVIETDNIIDELENISFFDGGLYVRLMAYVDRKYNKGLSLSAIETSIDNQNSDTAVLVDGLLAMTGEIRRFMATITSTLEKREETLSDVIEHLMEAREERMDSEMTAMSLDMELQAVQEAAGSSAKDKAIDVLSNTANEWIALQQRKQEITPENVINWIKNDPNFIQQAMKDEEIVSKVLQQMNTIEQK